jgi:acyl-coenzyme A thioesterase PaaI-like protein
MIKLKNPYAGLKGYFCFGCSPHNEAGLKMVFYEDGEEVTSAWEPDAHFQGFHDVLHGGIQSTMIDEIASWLVFIKLDTTGVTYRLNVRYRVPVHLSKGTVTLKARLKELRRNIATIQVDLYDGEGIRCSEGEVEYFTMPGERAREEFHFPGKQSFYE